MHRSSSARRRSRGARRAHASEAAPRPGQAEPIASNVRHVVEMERAALEERSALERLGDRAMALAGTPAFALVHVAWFGVWIIANAGWLPSIRPFDPYPFSFLTFVVSLEAIFLAIAVLIGENRAARLADRRAHLDLQINLLAEQESTVTLQLVRRIARHLGLEGDGDRKAADLAADTDIQDVLVNLEQQMPEQ